MQKKQIRCGLAIAAALAIAFSARAGEVVKHIKTVQLGDLPAVAQQALLTQAKGAAIEKIVKGPVFYVVKFTLDDQLQALTVSEDATLSEGPGRTRGREESAATTAIGWADLPAAVQNLVSTRFQGAPLQEIRKGTVIYTATLNSNGEKSMVRVTENGRILPQVVHRREPGAREQIRVHGSDAHAVAEHEAGDQMQAGQASAHAGGGGAVRGAGGHREHVSPEPEGK